MEGDKWLLTQKEIIFYIEIDVYYEETRTYMICFYLYLNKKIKNVIWMTYQQHTDLEKKTV